MGCKMLGKIGVGLLIVGLIFGFGYVSGGDAEKARYQEEIDRVNGQLKVKKNEYQEKEKSLTEKYERAKNDLSKNTGADINCLPASSVRVLNSFSNHTK